VCGQESVNDVTQSRDTFSSYVTNENFEIL